MRFLRRFGLYLLCFATVGVVRILLWTTRHQKIRAWLLSPCSTASTAHRQAAVGNVVRGIRRSACVIPAASCLTQTIACQAVLSWRGIPSVIEMGVRKEPGSPDLKAHAWLVWEDKIILEGDGETPSAFKTVQSLPTPTLPAKL
ncbi:MAG: lasso peptide biosynthesis B2 protein [Roseobacter sp.]